MDIEDLIQQLSCPKAYSYPVHHVEVIQTHISVVFLAGPFAWKIKKPVDLGFLDFSTLDKRRHFCEEEVRLNSPLAPGVYLGTAPVTCNGQLTCDGDGKAIDYAVKMQRLPEQATMEARLARNAVDENMMEQLGHHVADFHSRAERSERIAEFGRWDLIRRNCLENFEQSRGQTGVTIHPDVMSHLEERTRSCLDNLKELIEMRADSCFPIDSHGDLRLKHVYHFPEKSAGQQWMMLDRIEFNERFRFADPVSDIAFLCMDLLYAGRPDFVRALADSYFWSADDTQGRQLLNFYIAYRAAVRGKVEGFKAAEPEIPIADREEAHRESLAHWLLALSATVRPEHKPCLVLVTGLPGTGKSTLARSLSETSGFDVVSSDVVRKELAGLSPRTPSKSDFESGIYTPDWNDRTYATCLDRARELLFAGRRVVVDASFREGGRRSPFSNLAGEMALPCLILHCEADPSEVIRRLELRENDPSDADWDTYLHASNHNDFQAGNSSLYTRNIHTESSEKETADEAMNVLETAGLA